MCQINTHILMYWYAICTASYGKSLDFIVFLGYSHTFLTSIHIWIQMWLQVMKYVLILLIFFANFAQNWRIFMTLDLSSSNIHKLFIGCEYKHFDIIKYQMWQQVMERFLIFLHFLGIFVHIWSIVPSPNFHRLCVFPYIYFDILTGQMHLQATNYGRFLV